MRGAVKETFALNGKVYKKSELIDFDDKEYAGIAAYIDVIKEVKKEIVIEEKKEKKEVK